MLLHNKFIGQNVSDTSIPFTGGDEVARFEESLQTQPEDWYYRNVPISYTYNHNGHRCKNIEDINLNNYILFSGCSHTEGIGLELEKTYPYLVSQMLKCDYYNLAVSATGLDVVEHNLIVWLSTIPKKPKLIIIQWPDPSRFLSLNLLFGRLIPQGTWSDSEQTADLIATGDLSGAFQARRYLLQQNIKNVAGDIPILGVMSASLITYNSTALYFRILDKARDLSHSGIKSHQELANLILSNLPPNFI